jgi:LacI family transcriptional regulator
MILNEANSHFPPFPVRLPEGEEALPSSAMAPRTQNTMRHVAMLAGVSIATVSAVINGTAAVRPERKKRVLDAMAALNYFPDAIARGLKTGKTNAIGVVVPDITNAFYPEVIRGVEDSARQAGYSVLLCDSNEDPRRETDHLNSLFSRRVDGVLLACCVDSTSVSGTFRGRYPVVFIDRIPPVAFEGAVSSDNIHAGTMATRHLLDLGHQRIAMVVGHLGLSPHRDRLEGFRKAMQESHLPILDEYLVSGDLQIEDSLRTCRQLLDLPNPPTAIMVGNNKLLLGVLAGLEERAIRVPQQISILGFDDYLWNRYFSPSLTAVAQSTLEMGKRACELLLHSIKNDQEHETDATRRICLPTELRIRNSTAPPRSPEAWG